MEESGGMGNKEEVEKKFPDIFDTKSGRSADFLRLALAIIWDFLKKEKAKSLL